MSKIFITATLLATAVICTICGYSLGVSQSATILEIQVAQGLVEEGEQFKADYTSNNSELRRRAIERFLTTLDLVQRSESGLIQDLTLDYALAHARLANLHLAIGSTEQASYHADIAFEKFIDSQVDIISTADVYRYIQDYDSRAFPGGK